MIGKKSAPGEDRTHDLQIALRIVIMRLTRYLLRYRGICLHVRPSRFEVYARISNDNMHKPFQPIENKGKKVLKNGL